MIEGYLSGIATDDDPNDGGNAGPNADADVNIDGD